MNYKNEMYNKIFEKYKDFNYYDIENIYKNALLGIYNKNIIGQKNNKRRSLYYPRLAVNYAIKYALSYNNEYPNYKDAGGDCANFISQCLFAGGKSMVGNNPGNLDNWFCNSNNKWNTKLISSTWRGARAFSKFWSKNAREYKDFGIKYFNSFKTFNNIYRYASRGDIISFLDMNNIAYHTLIIVDYNNGDLICASHSYNSSNRSLFREKPEGGVRVYKVE